MSGKSVFTHLVAGIAGGIAGFAVGYFVADKTIGKKCKEQMDEMQEYYQRTDEYERVEHTDRVKRVKKGAPKAEKEGSEEKNKGLEADQKPKKVKKEERPVDYTKFYKEKGDHKKDFEQILAENEHPEEDFEEENEAEEDEALDILRQYQENKGKEPVLLEDYGEIPPGYNEEILSFYLYSDILVDEEGTIVEDPGRLVGDCLDKTGFADNNDKVLFVVNHEYATVYEIEKIFEEYEP